MVCDKCGWNPSHKDSELEKAIVRIDAAQLGGESLDDEPEYWAVELVTNTARKVANLDIDAATAVTNQLRFLKTGDAWDDLIYDITKEAVHTALSITEKDTHIHEWVNATVTGGEVCVKCGVMRGITEPA